MVSMYSDVDLDDVVLSDKKINNRGGNSVYINLKQVRMPQIQLADEDVGLKILFAPTINNTNEPHRRNMCLYANDDLVRFFTALDDMIIKESDKSNWFAGDDHKHKPILQKMDNDDVYIRFKINANFIKVFSKIDDFRYSVASIDDLKSGTRIIPVISVMPIWFFNSQYGTTFEITHALILRDDAC